MRDTTRNGFSYHISHSYDRLGVLLDQHSVKCALAALERGPIQFRRNNVIACEGDVADYIFVVVSGVVRSCKIFRNGDRSIVAFYLSGEIIGWSDQKHSLSIEAATDATVLFLKRDALMSLASRESRVSNFLLNLARNELRRAQDHATLISRTAKCRLAAFLSDIWKRSGNAVPFTLAMSHQDIADHLGLRIETLSRTIGELERGGLIARLSTREIAVRNNHLLSHLMN